LSERPGETRLSSKITPKLLDYIERHCDRRVSLKQLARFCAYQPSYFSHVFKTSMGITLTEYVTKLRIGKAMLLLAETDCSVERICHATGYGEKKLFYKHFKRATGLTPSRYRETIQKSR
jgi:YesN/AraC family two-component response regulator